MLAMGLVAVGEWEKVSTYLATASLIVGYGQLLVANDSVRLYQWAAPAVLLALTPITIEVWMYPVIAAHPFIGASSKRV